MALHATLFVLSGENPRDDPVGDPAPRPEQLLAGLFLVGVAVAVVMIPVGAEIDAIASVAVLAAVVVAVGFASGRHLRRREPLPRA